MKTANVSKTDNGYMGKIYDLDCIGDYSVSVRGDGHYCSIFEDSLEDVLKELRIDGISEENIFIV